MNEFWCEIVCQARVIKVEIIKKVGELIEFDCFWRVLEYIEGFWRFQRVFEKFRRVFKGSRGFWRVFGGFWKVLEG